MTLPLSSPALQQTLSTVELVNKRNPFLGQVVPSAPPVPILPEVPSDASNVPASVLVSTQQALNALQYNFLPSTFFSLKKNRPLHKIVSAGHEILQVALPIRCLEATFVGIALTQGFREIHRLPIAFKSRCGGKDYRHIVLAVKCNGLYGAVGLSRRESLMDKPVVFPSLAALLNEYLECYAKIGHDVVSFKPGLFVSHDSSSKLVPCWRFVSVTIPAGTRSVLEHAPTREIITSFENQLLVLSGEYNMLPPDAKEVKAAMTYGKFVSDDGDEEAEAVSDSEENQRRVACLLREKSPFDVVVPASPYSTSSAFSDSVGAKFSSKLRRVVSGCSLPSSTPVTPNAPAPRPHRASSTSSSFKASTAHGGAAKRDMSVDGPRRGGGV